jgi:hypothetical protein
MKETKLWLMLEQHPEPFPPSQKPSPWLKRRRLRGINLEEPRDTI